MKRMMQREGGKVTSVNIDTFPFFDSWCHKIIQWFPNILHAQYPWTAKDLGRILLVESDDG
jgi:hypothetical protein